MIIGALCAVSPTERPLAPRAASHKWAPAIFRWIRASSLTGAAARGRIVRILTTLPKPEAPSSRHGNVLLFASPGAGMSPALGRATGRKRAARDFRYAGQDEDPGGQFQPADRRGDRRLSRRAADPLPGAALRRYGNLRRNPGKRARARHVHRPVDLLPHQRQSDGAADHDRRAAPRLGAAASRRSFPISATPGRTASPVRARRSRPSSSPISSPAPAPTAC